MSSVICFNLDQSKILSPGNGLDLYYTTKLNCPKAFADNKFNSAKKKEVVFDSCLW